MNGAELEALLSGLLRLWQAEGRVRAIRGEDQISARIEGGDAATITVTWLPAPFGIVWQVQPAGGRLRTYPSVIGLIRDLRERLAPERNAARVLFAWSADRGGSYQ